MLTLLSKNERKMHYCMKNQFLHVINNKYILIVSDPYI